MPRPTAPRRRVNADPRTPVKQERFGARLSSAQKALLERAADLTGRTLSEFILGAAQAAAEETIHRHHVLELSERESKAFLQALDDAPRLQEGLEEAIRDAATSVETCW